MKAVYFLIVAVVALLGLAAGLAKVLQTPQEMEFLQGLGLSSLSIVVFGALQMMGGILVVPKQTRMAGGVIAMLTFLFSAVLIFMAGNTTFGMISMIPIALAAVIINRVKRTRPG